MKKDDAWAIAVFSFLCGSFITDLGWVISTAYAKGGQDVIAALCLFLITLVLAVAVMIGIAAQE